MVFRAKGAKTFKLRVVAPSGGSATLSTECRIRGDAKDVERVVKQWQGRSPLGRAAERPALLELLVGPTPRPLTLRQAYDLDVAGTLDDWFTARADAERATDDAAAAAAADVDLHSYVTAWHRQKAKSKKGAGMADQYLRQLRALYPADKPFTLSLWTRKELKARLLALPLNAEGSRNRYRAAASSFCETLLDEEFVEINLVRTIRGWSENPAREVWYRMEDAKRLIPALDRPFRGYSATLAAFCMEVSAAKRLRASEVALLADPVKARAHGGKRPWRDRVVPLVPELDWLLPYIREAVEGKLPTALVFDGIPDWRVVKHQQKVAKALGIAAVGEEKQGAHNLHDWRHSHAVWLAQHGYPGAIGMAHLGHKDMVMYNRIYAVHRPDAHDYALHRARQTARATKVATTRPRKRGHGG